MNILFFSQNRTKFGFDILFDILFYISQKKQLFALTFFPDFYETFNEIQDFRIIRDIRPQNSNIKKNIHNTPS